MTRSTGGSLTRRARIVGASALLLLAAGTLAACGEGEQQSTTSGPIRIGMNAEITGPVPALGKSVEGAEAAVKYINDNGGIDGRKIELEVSDNAGDATRAVTNIRNFRDDGIELVLSGTFISDCDAVAPFLTQQKMLGVCTSIADLSEETRANQFGVGPSYTQTVNYAIDYLAQEVDSVGVLAEKSVSGDNTQSLAEEAGERNDIDIHVERVDITANSAKPQIQKLIADGAEALYLYSCSGIGVTGPGDAQSLGFTGPILVPECFASDAGEGALAAAAADDQVRVFVPEFVLGEWAEDDPQAEAIETYMEEVGTRDGVVGAGWDSIMILKAAIEKAGSSDPEDVRKAFDGLEYTGVWSVGTFGEDESGRGGTVEGVLVPAKVTPEGFAPIAGGQ
jgi:branched-chain amino acid transport system substrate-binding protein